MIVSANLMKLLVTASHSSMYCSQHRPFPILDVPMTRIKLPCIGIID